MRFELFIVVAICIQFLFKNEIISIFSKLEKNWVVIPATFFSIALAIATGLFTSASIISARKSSWTGDDVYTTISILTGIVLGFTAKV